MELFENTARDITMLKAVVFDFDGTLSTLRYGWEAIMEPLMVEMIAGQNQSSLNEEIRQTVKEYINSSTGIQTIYQMQWLVETIKKYKRNMNFKDDPWWYKEEYNRRLMKTVEKRKAAVLSGAADPHNYLIKGSMEFLERLKGKGIELYAASGTDHIDVVREAEILKLNGFFTEIAGAPERKADCSKEAILKKLLLKNGFKGFEVLVVGDGKVEIALGREMGYLTLGVASDEMKLSGINTVKRDRLLKAGAHAITGDFSNVSEIFEWLGLNE